MKEIILVLIAGIIMLGVGIPAVISYEKWKKVLKDADAEMNGAGGEENVQD